MSLRRFLAPATALALVLIAMPSVAQTPMDDPLDSRDSKRVDRMEKVVRELRAIVFQGRDTGKPVVVQPAETEYQMQELTRRVNDLEETLRRVNGQLENAAHQLDQAQRDSQAMQAQNKALSDRLAAVEQMTTQPPAPAEGTLGAPPPAGADLGAAAAAAPGASATDAFAGARQLMLNGDYDGAEQAWRDYTARYPKSPKAAEAQYWLGKTLSVRAAHPDAAAAYIVAIKGYPATSWAPDAMVELSRSLVAMKRPSDACNILAELAKRYPKATPYSKNRAAQISAQAKCA